MNYYKYKSFVGEWLRELIKGNRSARQERVKDWPPPKRKLKGQHDD